MKKYKNADFKNFFPSFVKVFKSTSKPHKNIKNKNPICAVKATGFDSVRIPKCTASAPSRISTATSGSRVNALKKGAITIKSAITPKVVIVFSILFKKLPKINHEV